MTWFHGGPRIVGDWVLSPAATGTTSTSDIVANDVHDCHSVYIVNDRVAATMFAAVHPNGWVYEVEPVGPLGVDPDFTPDDTDLQSASCERARILRRFKVSAADQRIWREVLLGGD